MSETYGGGRRFWCVMDSPSLLLEKHLWPVCNRRDIWMILDCARDPQIFALLLESYLEYGCLFAGFIPKALEASVPYLVQLESEDRRCRRLVDRAWGNSWGVILKCDTRLDSLRRHLRGFLTVRTPFGDRCFFRYYDPRILRVYLPTCTNEELRTIFGPIETFWVEDTPPPHLLRFELDGSRLATGRLTLSAPAPRQLVLPPERTSPARRYPGMLAIRREQWAMLSRAQTSQFEDWMVAHLHKFFRRQCAAMTEAHVRETIQYGIQRAAAYGIDTRRDVCKYIDVMFALGNDFDRNEQLPWALNILTQSTRSAAARAQTLLQAAVRHLKQFALASHA